MFDYIVKVIKSPKNTFKEEIPTLAFVMFLIFGGLVNYLYLESFLRFGLKNFLNLYKQIVPNIDEFINTFSVDPVKLLLLSIIIPVIFLFLTTAIYELGAQLFFKKQNGVKLMKNLAFASIPMVFGRLLYSIFMIFNVHFLTLINFLFSIWEVLLFIIAISETYEIDKAKAVIIYLLPLILIVISLIPLFI